MLAHVEDIGLAPPGSERAASFDAFYAAAAPMLVRQLHAMTGDLADAQDCVQEACARAWQRWGPPAGLRGPGGVGADRGLEPRGVPARRVRTAARALVRSGRPADVPDLSPDHVALVAALRTLPADQRRALVLHHLADRPTAQQFVDAYEPGVVGIATVRTYCLD